jgi:DNA-binding response OmpR family regulator
MNRTIKILLVEDDPLIQDAITDILEDSVYCVETARNGHETLTLIAKRNYDIILTDIIMDEMDGVALIRELRKINASVPIIGMSGNPVGFKFLPSLRLFGVKTTLLKPFSRDELVSAINYALDAT